ncbi:hypothetical protein LO762_16365 [Actinocorallia sp. API 0066]|uniref:hypothetical protein n=1 Tax=Actinocorallia sp. API 0066 TaxID=2896846 RepID=UPI001E29FED6|nr:hypothetical protein [Actinocorallia sp. API 0066]MCD0450752.1 hypothetical protein [Actinocorallia sp. API 0066]
MSDLSFGVPFDAAKLDQSQRDGLACVVCRRDHAADPAPALPVGVVDGGQVFACRACVFPEAASPVVELPDGRIVDAAAWDQGRTVLRPGPLAAAIRGEYPLPAPAPVLHDSHAIPEWDDPAPVGVYAAEMRFMVEREGMSMVAVRWARLGEALGLPTTAPVLVLPLYEAAELARVLLARHVEIGDADVELAAECLDVAEALARAVLRTLRAEADR